MQSSFASISQADPFNFWATPDLEYSVFPMQHVQRGPIQVVQIIRDVFPSFKLTDCELHVIFPYNTEVYFLKQWGTSFTSLPSSAYKYSNLVIVSSYYLRICNQIRSCIREATEYNIYIVLIGFVWNNIAV